MNEVDFSKVGLKMKQLRSERGITQEQVSVDTILDAGRDIPPLDEKEHQLNDEMLNVFRGFSVTEKEKIIKMLRIWQEK